MKTLHIIAFSLVIIGGINWGFTAFGKNLVDMILGAWPVVEQVVYVLVALSAVYLAATHKSDCRTCAATGTM